MQKTLFDPHHNELTPDFDGKTYSPELDHDRLDSALAKVYRLMLDGQWRTIAKIAEAVGCSETGASARLRDFRKEKWQIVYGHCRVESQRCSERGLWIYRVVKGT